MINNELRRLKQKLALFDQEALNWVLSDLLDLADTYDDDVDQWSSESKLMLISILQNKYKKEIEELTPDNPSQTKLFAV